ncbi:MAG: hypothetical protein JXA82_18245 [Sedimentisphaerales bacterium]|nr:hypothetical protein [Sedimentisphaerales bacterium]
MNDFSSKEEALAFFLSGPLMPAEQFPLVEIDCYFHGVELTRLGLRPEELTQYMTRFQMTFCKRL